MAQPDLSILQGIRPVQIDTSRLESPVNQMANMYQLQGAAQANQLRGMQMEAAQRELTQQNFLADVYKKRTTPEGGIDYEGVMRDLASGGHGALIPGLVKTQREAQKAETEYQAAKNKLVTEKLALSRDALDRIDPKAPDAAQQYLAWHNSNHKDPVLGPYLQSIGATQDKAFQQISQAINAGKLPELIELSKVGATKMQELHAPKLVSRDAHNQLEIYDENPRSPTYSLDKPLRVIKKGTTEHEQVMQKLREQEIIEQKRAHRVTESQAGQVITDEKGNVTVLDKFGRPMRTMEGAGKKSATYEKTQAQQKQMQSDINLAIKELKDAAKDGGLIDQSTGSGAGRLYDLGARFVGKATEGDLAIGKLQPVADLALKMVPRFEGPQSDKDTQSYKEAAGQLADATLPREIRKAAAKTVVRLMEARKNQFITGDMASGNTAVPEAVAPPAGFVVDK